MKVHTMCVSGPNEVHFDGTVMLTSCRWRVANGAFPVGTMARGQRGASGTGQKARSPNMDDLWREARV